MKWPWSKKTNVSWNDRVQMDKMRLRGPGGARIDLSFENVTRQSAMEEAIFRLTSAAGKGIQFNGCPECGCFGHGMERHKEKAL